MADVTLDGESHKLGFKSRSHWITDKLRTHKSNEEAGSEEAQNRGVLEVIRELCRDYTEYTSLHGVQYTTQTRYTRARRIVWGIIVAATVCGLLYTLTFQVLGLIKGPTFSQMTLEQKTQMPFPAVTLCSLNKARQSLLEDKPEVLRVLLGIAEVSDKGSDKASADVPVANITEEDVRWLSHQMSSTLIQCLWDGKEQPCSKLFTTIKTDMGYCFSFNHRTGESRPRFSKRLGHNFGLTVVANIQQNEYILDPNTHESGLRVLLHGYDETPLVEGGGFNVSPGTASKISLEMLTVKNLPPPFTTLDGSSCLDMADGNVADKPTLKLFDKYDLNACRYECRYNYIFDRCQCRSPYDPGNDTICDSNGLATCIIPNFDYFMDNDLYQSCDCQTPCEWSIYTPRISSATYPSLALMRATNDMFNINSTEEEFRNNYLKFDIGFEVFLLETVEQVQQYTSESTLSTFGGQMGMFIGASLLSVLEFMEFVILLIVAKVTHGKTKKPEVKNEETRPTELLEHYG